MKENDSILPITPKLDLEREFIVARPEVSRILSQNLELHKTFQATNVLESLGLGRIIEEWRHTAREIVALPALAVAENSRLFDGLRLAMSEANSLLAQQMESYRLAASTVQTASQEWARDFASASALMADVAKLNFALPEQALLHWSENLVAIRAPLLDDCIRNMAALEALHSAAIVPAVTAFPEHLVVANRFVFDHAEVVRRLPPRLPEPQEGERAEEHSRHRDEEVGTRLELALGEVDIRFVELRRQAWRNVAGGIAGARLAMAGIREIFTDILRALSPEAEVMKTAAWQTRPVQKDTRVTRRMRLVYVVGDAKAAELEAAFQFDESVRRTQKFVHTFADDPELVRVQMAELENWIYLLLHFAKSRSGDK